MAIVYQMNKKSGTRYAYESTSVWDPQRKQARNTRKYLGKVGEDGTIIPSSGKPGRPPKTAGPNFTCRNGESSQAAERIQALELENRSLKNEVNSLKNALEKITDIASEKL